MNHSQLCILFLLVMGWHLKQATLTEGNESVIASIYHPHLHPDCECHIETLFTSSKYNNVITRVSIGAA